MTKIVGVRFQKAGKIYYFDPGEFDLDMAMHVIVETARGLEMGTVLIPPKDVEDDTIVTPLKPVIRVATDEDEEMAARSKEKEHSAYQICKAKILEHELDMKLVAAEYTFDGSKLLFYFTADGRIDFRELVKDLAAVFRTRIELRQIGVRDETKLLGGIGICGRPLCCSTYLSEFIPVSIKMAKEQNLSLNPTKISGVCGRLMCCLKNEQDTYEYLNSRLPNVGAAVDTPSGEKGVVSSVNVLRQTVKVLIDNGNEKEMKEYHVNELGANKSHHRKDTRLTAEEMRELEGILDGEERQEKDGGRRERRKDNRQERRNRGENPENRQEHAENPGREERQGRSRKESRPRREERPNREDRSNREERPNREDRPNREERPNRQRREDRANKEDRTNREERPNKEERINREERPNKEERINREERANKEDRPRKERFRRNRNHGKNRENGDNTDGQ